MPLLVSEQGTVGLSVRRVPADVSVSGSGRTAVTVVAKTGSGTADAKRGARITVQQKLASVAAGTQAAAGLVRKQFYVQDTVPPPVVGLPLLLFQTGQTADPNDVIPKVIL